jgi:hypothetical protein
VLETDVVHDLVLAFDVLSVPALGAHRSPTLRAETETRFTLRTAVGAVPMQNGLGHECLLREKRSLAVVFAAIS